MGIEVERSGSTILRPVIQSSTTSVINPKTGIPVPVIYVPTVSAVSQQKFRNFHKGNPSNDLTTWVRAHPADVVQFTIFPHFCLALRTDSMLAEYHNALLEDPNCIVFIDVSGKMFSHSLQPSIIIPYKYLYIYN
jgi:hypothetical protein